MTLSPCLRLGANRGYRFDADTVELNATLEVADPAAFDRHWALQLWACPSTSPSGKLPVGFCVATAPLAPLREIADAGGFVVSTVGAQPPAGDRDYTMMLVLAAQSGDRFGEVHDAAVFPARERFVLPRLVAPSSYKLEGDRVRLEVAGVENPRAHDNVSGTLSLELWALDRPYEGGSFEGSPVAGVILGSLAGGCQWADRVFDLPCATIAAATWHPVLMLREWVGGGYLTRDFVGFDKVPAPPAPDAPAVKTVVAAPVVKASRKSAAGKVSINAASLQDLATVKGLPRAVAERIIAGRPFGAVDDLVAVKGMGRKLLAKLRSKLDL